MAGGPVGAELAQMPREDSFLASTANLLGDMAKRFWANPDDPNGSRMRIAGSLLIAGSAVEYFLGAQGTAEIISDPIIALGGVAAIGASYFPDSE